MVKLIELAKMVDVMYEADHAYSVWRTGDKNLSANNVSFEICIIHSASTFAKYLNLSKLTESPNCNENKTLSN